MSQEKVTPRVLGAIYTLIILEHILSSVVLATHGHMISGGIFASITADYFHVQLSWNGLPEITICECRDIAFAVII